MFGKEDPLIDRVLAGKFRLRKRIGEGSYGAVYLADQIPLNRSVAVKVLSSNVAGDSMLVQRFHDEAVAASRLNHPNTVSIIDFGQTNDDLLYLVMEYVRGKPLREIIRHELPLTDARLVDIMHQILDGLEEAHEAKVIHADLKPENIIVEERRNNALLLHLVDFGVARILGTLEEATDRATVCGTPEYLAPELIRGQEANVTSDLYAAGILLYELLTGMTPFSEGSTLDVLNAHLRNQPVLPSLRRPDFPVNSTLEGIALRALAKDPADRFASAAAFRQQLDGAVTQALWTDGVDVLCEGCGVSGPSNHKFCHECGMARSEAKHAETETHAETQQEEEPTGIFPLPLEGRDDSLNRLIEFLSTRDSSGALFLVGPTGSGRSRLLRTASHCVDEETAPTVFIANPDPSGLRSPFYPIRAIVAAVMSLPPVCPYDSLKQEVMNLGLSERDMPGIAELFGFESELWPLDPPVRRRELVASTIRALSAGAKHRQGLLVFEDVDRYDNPSQEFLRRLQESEGKPQVLLTSTPEFAARWPADTERIHLSLLDARDVDLLLDHVLSHTSDFPPKAELAPLTDGSPSSVAQLVRYLVEGGTILTAPRGTANTIAARLELLPRAARLVAQTCAVLGSETLREPLVMALEGVLDRTQIYDGLVMLRARAFIAFDAIAVSFGSQLTRDVVYSATPADVRRRLHAAVAQALEQATTDPAIRGHHRELAGDLAEATPLLTQAGDGAVHQFDEMGATRLYQRALACARELMLADKAESRLAFVALSIKLADSLRVVGEVSLVRGLLEEARGYCSDAPALKAQLMRASARMHSTLGANRDAMGELQNAIGLAIPAGNTELLCSLYLDLSSLFLQEGEAKLATEELEEALNMVTLGEGARGEFGPPNLWRLLLRLGQLYCSTGEHRRGMGTAEDALYRARQIRSALGAAKTQSMLATEYERVGNLQKSERYRQGAIDEMRKLGDRRGTAELLLAGLKPTRTLVRVSAGVLREAEELAGEVGWAEGVLKARPKSIS